MAKQYDEMMTPIRAAWSDELRELARALETSVVRSSPVEPCDLTADDHLAD